MADVPDVLRDALADRYRLDREIGQGATATVFLAEDLKHRRPVALKVLRPELTALLGTERFLGEIELAARLTHPHILPLYDSGGAGDALYYVMPFVAGESLRDRLAREKQLPVADALRVAREVANALAYAHRLGVIHRDIKPENILLQEGHAVVGDFGIARALSVAGGERLTRSGVTLGTPAYMSPEQSMGSGELDGRSDLYSLGCVLYEMLAGQPPFTAPTAEALVYQHLSVEPRAVSTVRPSVPATVNAIIARSLAKTPADRFRDAAEMARALETAGAHAISEGAAAVHTEAHAGAPGGPAAAATGAATPVAAARRPAARRAPRWLLPAAVAAAVLLAAVGWMVWRSRSLSARAVSPGAVAVLPFTVRGGPTLAYLGEGMVDLLGTSLDGAAELRRVDPHALMSYLRRTGGDMGPERGRAVAAHFEAPYFVLGEVLQLGPRLRLQASLYERMRAGGPVAEGSVEGEEREISALVDRLAAKLLSEYTGQRVALGGRLARLAGVTTHSLPALKAYLQGEQEFRRAHYAPAVEAFQRAVAEDSTFALGWYRLSVALGWVPGTLRFREAERAGELAVRYGGRLTERDRELLLSRQALNAGLYAESRRRAQSVVDNHPEDALAWNSLAEVIYHGNPFRGRSNVEAQPALERVVHLDPEATEPLNHLIEIALKQRRVPAADSLIRRLEAAAPGADGLAECRLMLAAVRRDRATWDRLAPEVVQSPMPRPGQFLSQVAITVEDLPAAEQVAQAIIRSAENPQFHAMFHALHASLLLGGGRWHAAREALRASTSLERGTGISQGAFLTAISPFPVGERELREVRSAVEGWRGPTAEDSLTRGTFGFRHPGMYRVVRSYLLGLLSARLGDDGAVLAQAAEVERSGDTEEARRLARELSAGLRARVAWRRSGPAEALRVLEAAEPTGWFGPPSGFRSKAHERHLRAELLRALGRDEEALGWYEGLVEVDLFGLPYLAPSHLRRAEICEKLGRRAQAIHHYRRFLELWDQCDPELRPEVDQARHRLERLMTLQG